MKHIYLSVLFSLIMNSLLWGQASNTIRLRTGVVNFTADFEKIIPQAAQSAKSDVMADFPVLIQLENHPTEKDQKAFFENGIQIVDYVQQYVYLAKISSNISVAKLKEAKVKGIARYENRLKLDKKLMAAATTQSKIELLISLFPDIDHKKAIKELQQWGTLLEGAGYLQTTDLVSLTIASVDLPTIAALPYVKLIQAAYPVQNFITTKIATQRVAPLQATSGLGLSGQGVSVSVADGGFIINHIDLNERIINEESLPESSHGAFVTGVVAGEGKLSTRAKGIAPQAEIVAGFYNYIFTVDTIFYPDSTVSLTNNSWGSAFDCNIDNQYDEVSKFMDDFTLKHPSVLHVFASGNSGTLTCSPYPKGYRTVVQGWQAAKNVLTVGATNSADIIANYSSRGPVSDGRIKPELVAMGSGIYSASTLNGFLSASGTSYSAPVVTGIGALLTEQYKNLNNNELPEAGLLKAILCNSADDLGNRGPDYIYGFGKANALKAAACISDSLYRIGELAESAIYTDTLDILADIETVKVMLYWADTTNATLATQALVNNLDLEVVKPNGNLVYPWLLDTTATDVANLAVKGTATQRDSINNIEQVTIDTVEAGKYVVRVLGTTIPFGNQRFYLAYQFLKKEVALTYPIGGEELAAGENLLMTWEDTIGLDTTWRLRYSLDNGNSWSVLDTAYDQTKNQYTFQLPQAASDEVLFTVASNRDTIFYADTSQVVTIMSVPSLQVSTSCAQTATLSWSATTNTDHYEIYEFVNNDWSLLTTTTDLSYVHSGLTIGEQYCYTIKSVSAANVKSRNAIGKCITAYGTSIDSFPYRATFETNEAAWFAGGKNLIWEWGQPNATLIDKAGEGQYAWVTQLDSDYPNGAVAYLYSPCFDLSGMTDPILSFSLIYDIENVEPTDNSGATFYDYLQLWYSTNGINWNRLGNVGDGDNWYNNRFEVNIWDDTKAYWHTARIAIPTTSGRVQFRFLLDSDRFTVEEGAGIDNVFIYDEANSNHAVSLQATLALEGSFDTLTLLMQDTLNRQNLIPLQEPFTTLNYEISGAGGGETIKGTILENQGDSAIVDWVLLEIRDTLTPTQIHATKAVLLRRDGTIVDVDGNTTIKIFGLKEEEYHVAFRHRHHGAVMTAAPVLLQFEE